jgi:hypothetical protein
MRPDYPRVVATEGLHITYRRSGGIAGVDMAAECLGADLPQDQAQVASDLLAAPTTTPERGADANADSSTAHSRAGADQFSYTVRITQGPRSRTFNWSEGTVPDHARPLLTTLGGFSEPSRVQ